MKNGYETPTFISLSFLLLLLAPSIASSDTTDIVVKGKKLDEAMSSGDYYNIGKYYADLQKAEWERQQRTNQRTGGGGESTENSEQQEKETCEIEAALERNECERDAHETYSNNIKSCPSGFSFSIPYIGSLQYQTGAFNRCEVNMRSTRNNHLVICKEVELRYRKSECL